MRPAMRAVTAAALSCAAVAAQDVPEGVRYTKAPAEVNAQAEASLRAALSGERRVLAGIFAPGAKPLIIGPFLSRTLTDSGLVDAMQFGKATYRVPLGKDVKPESPGIVARDAKERAALDEALERWLPATRQFVLRPLTPDELALVWFFISWDLKEPLFAVDMGGRTLVVDFEADRRSVFWIEDLSHPCFRLAWQGGSTGCYCSVVVPDGPRRRVMFRPRPDAAGTCAPAGGQAPQP